MALSPCCLGLATNCLELHKNLVSCLGKKYSLTSDNYSQQLPEEIQQTDIRLKHRDNYEVFCELAYITVWTAVAVGPRFNQSSPAL